ncbi:ctx-related type i transmembrane protein [Holotrichia oblita]|uniref:Ctx-related type i transmembrane protein n=1 Tax=Holotrichia oblita TaxID=644536 RepID=A0ACB9T9S6_HOLOL|nr:ctx-related type i transmembrane protein [Holotrichia oblita]
MSVLNLILAAREGGVPESLFGQDTPALEIQPHGQELSRVEGESMALTCKLQAGDVNQVSQLEWLDSRDEVIRNTDIRQGIYIQQLQDENGIMLIFAKLIKSMEGKYTCRGSYAKTEQLQATVTLKIIMDITWTNVPPEQFPIIGTNKKLACVVNGDPYPIIDWLRGGQRITTDSNSRYIIETDGLQINNVQESDDGLYTCRALVTATGKVDERIIRVEVLIPPKMDPILPVQIVEGDTARIKCKAFSKPPSNYTWIREDTREDLSIKDRFTVDERTGILSISRIERQDDSIYQCVARNPAGTAEQSVNITVLAKPKIFELINITAPVENDTQLICKASGRPAPQVTFRKLNRQDRFALGVQSDNPRITLENQVFEKKGETFAKLIIKRLTRHDDGLYECIAENGVEKAYKNGHIAVEFPLHLKEQKTIRQIENRPPASHLIVTPYHNRAFYGKYECIATNKLGQNRTFLELREAKVPGPIQQVTIEAVTATTIKFNIVGPADATGLPLRSFVVQFKVDIMTWDTAWNKTWSVNAPYIIEGLSPQRTYQFRFAAINDVGIGGYGGGNQQYTMPTRSVPTEPKILVPAEYAGLRDILVNSPYADHYELRWKVPHDNGDPIDYYVIRFCVTEFRDGQWLDSTSECSSEITVSFQYQSYELDNLVPDTTYKLELRAHNPIGLSSPAQIRVKTARGLDVMIPSSDSTYLSSGLILGIVIACVVVVLILVDIICFCVNRTGVLAFCCDCARSKRVDEEDSKLGSTNQVELTTVHNNSPSYTIDITNGAAAPILGK